MTGASQANGLGSAKAPEPQSRLGPAGAIPSAHENYYVCKKLVGGMVAVVDSARDEFLCFVDPTRLYAGEDQARARCEDIAVIFNWWLANAASVDTRRMAETAKTGSVRSTGSAVPEGETPNV